MHYGTSVPDALATVKRPLRANATLTHDELIELCDVLWSAGVHE